ncbi:DUF924 family protein [Elioraea rosea]|uniref:DUF924 family protein n=1 Tax=Elioraea rosea TaxID=2492390 RepID=UPI001181E3E6|nr:DUF924 family protein [Elioraea rosea]
MTETAESLVLFWREAGPERWFARDDAFDALFRYRFMALHLEAAARQHDDWSGTAEGALALLLLLDQFPRNCFRGTGHMYATDPLARMFADRAIAAGHDQATGPELRLFFYLPYCHAEDMAAQERAVALITPLGEEPAGHARGHRDIIRRFGRFPHRNPMLGRETTAEEQAFLDAGGFRG